MISWEYRARTFHADKNNRVPKEYIEQAYPDWKFQDVPEHHPVTLEAYLNNWGEAGWELVSIESIVREGDKGDLGFTYPPQVMIWHKAYFCVFKRPIEQQQRTSSKIYHSIKKP